MQIDKAASNQSFHSSEDTELLVVNLLESRASLENPLTSCSTKLIGQIPDEDRIEVFVSSWD